jgi:hypothetical protein
VNLTPALSGAAFSRQLERSLAAQCLSEVLRMEARALCDARQHARAKFLSVVERESEIGPTIAF